MFRQRSGIGRWVVCATVPYAIALLVGTSQRGPAILAVSSLLAGVAAVSGLAVAARRFGADPLLAASFGLDARVSRVTAMIVPGAAGVVWALAVAPAMIIVGPAVMALVVPALSLLLVQYRVSQQPYEATHVMGALYNGDLVRRFVRGPGPLVGACLFVGWPALALG